MQSIRGYVWNLAFMQMDFLFDLYICLADWSMDEIMKSLYLHNMCCFEIELIDVRD